MKAGSAPRLDRRIVILEASFAENEAGEEVATGWAEYAEGRAQYTPVSDGERMRAASVEQKTDARFVVRWSIKLAAVNGENRIRFDGADWQITGVKEIGRGLWIEITAWRIR
ncbi:head-tail adaptor protein [Phaeobacter sp. CAU 1743]|uniref:head-tail adaptor protein n=1 Tax=Phaeobacter sp. CAU 1743 TaxID=3140367 RepID=UPI00325B64EB